MESDLEEIITMSKVVIGESQRSLPTAGSS